MMPLSGTSLSLFRRLVGLPTFRLLKMRPVEELTSGVDSLLPSYSLSLSLSIDLTLA